MSNRVLARTALPALVCGALVFAVPLAARADEGGDALRREVLGRMDALMTPFDDFARVYDRGSTPLAISLEITAPHPVAQSAQAKLSFEDGNHDGALGPSEVVWNRALDPHADPTLAQLLQQVRSNVLGLFDKALLERMHRRDVEVSRTEDGYRLRFRMTVPKVGTADVTVELDARPLPSTVRLVGDGFESWATIEWIPNGERYAVGNFTQTTETSNGLQVQLQRRLRYEKRDGTLLPLTLEQNTTQAYMGTSFSLRTTVAFRHWSLEPKQRPVPAPSWPPRATARREPTRPTGSPPSPPAGGKQETGGTQALARALDAGVPAVAQHARDLTWRVLLHRASVTRTAEFRGYWLAPGRLAIVPASEQPSAPERDAAQALSLYLHLNPLVCPHAVLFDGAETARGPNGTAVRVPIEGGLHVIFTFDPQGRPRGVHFGRQGNEVEIGREFAETRAGTLLRSLTLHPPRAPMRLVRYRYTRKPGWVWIKRLLAEPVNSEGRPRSDAGMSFEAELVDLQVDTGAAKAYFEAQDAQRRANRDDDDLFEDDDEPGAKKKKNDDEDMFED